MFLCLKWSAVKSQNWKVYVGSWSLVAYCMATHRWRKSQNMKWIVLVWEGKKESWVSGSLWGRLEGPGNLPGWGDALSWLLAMQTAPLSMHPKLPQWRTFLISLQKPHSLLHMLGKCLNHRSLCKCSFFQDSSSASLFLLCVPTAQLRPIIWK